MTKAENKPLIPWTEDWTAVFLGFLIIVLTLAGMKIPSPVLAWKSTTELFDSVLSLGNLGSLALLFTCAFAIVLAGTWMLGKNLSNTLMGFPIVFLLTTIALILAGNAVIKNWNLEAVIFSLGIGLIISNFFKVPDWIKTTLSTELFVKIGLVLLGTSVIFSDVLKAGSLGLVQAVLVVISVWYFAYWVCKKLKVDEELAIMISSAVSICGVSAAIASSGVIKGDPKKLSYVISVVLITAIPMIIILPLIARFLGLSEEVTGAWLGGTIDTTGAVIASGAMVGETAVKISTIVKFSQNVLLGLAAFAISIYWTYSKNQTSEINDSKPTLGLIWERFPKFVLGFIGASLLFSFFITIETMDAVKGGLKSLQGLWFALAFTSIGLETRFSDLFKLQGRKPLYAFLLAQLFNVIITLGIAYLLFGK